MTAAKIRVIGGDRGQQWASRLRAALERIDGHVDGTSQADAVAVVMTPTSADSRRCGLEDELVGEIRAALESSALVTPVLCGVRDVVMPLDVPGSLDDLQYRIAVPVPSDAALPETAARLVAAATMAARQAEVGNKGPPVLTRPLLRPPTAPWRRQLAHEYVFVSYRRDDTSYWSRELAKNLSQILGPAFVFFDVGSGTPGLDFRRLIDDAVSRSAAMAVVVGTQYLASGPGGERRIDDEHDWVRAELRVAIRRGTPMRVVLVGSARAPVAGELPEDIRALADVELVGSIRTGTEIRRIVAAVLEGTRTGELLQTDQAGGSMTGYADALSATSPVASVRDGLRALGWELQDPDLSKPQVLLSDRHPDHRFSVEVGDRVVVLSERTSRRWEPRVRFSITGATLGPVGIMQLEPRLLEAAVHPGAYLDRTGRETVSRRGSEWPGGLDPVNYDLVSHEVLPMTFEAWNDTLRHMTTASDVRLLASPRLIALDADQRVEVAFTPGGERLVASTGDWLRLIEVRTGEQIAARRHEQGGRWTAVGVSGDGRVAAGSTGGMIIILDADLELVADHSFPRRRLRALADHWGWKNEIRSLCWSSDGLIGAATNDAAWILDPVGGSFDRYLHPTDAIDKTLGPRAPLGVCFLGPTTRLVIQSTRDLWVIDPPPRDAIDRLEPEWLAGSEWKNSDVPDAHWPRRMLGTLSGVTSGPQGDVIAVAGSDGQVGVATPGPLSVDRIISWHEPTTTASNDVLALAIGPHGVRLATVATTGKVVVGNIESGRPELIGSAERGLTPYRPSMAWSPDGTHLALGVGRGVTQSDGGVLVWTL